MTVDETRGGVAAVVLAAGASRRFRATTGRHKLLAELGGQPLIAWTLEAACAARVDEVVVVVDPADEVADVVRAWQADKQMAGQALPSVSFPTVTIVVNEQAASGQATSVVAGLRAAMATTADVAVILLADEPQVSSAAIGIVASAVDPHGHPLAARARYGQQPGHPVAFARALWPMLCERLDGDVGARAVFDELAIAEVAVSGPRPIDVDDVADLERARRSGRRGDTTLPATDRQGPVGRP